MEKELIDQFQILNGRFNNIDTRLNLLDTRFINFKKKKDYQIVSAIIGSPIAVLLANYFLGF